MIILSQVEGERGAQMGNNVTVKLPTRQTIK